MRPILLAVLRQELCDELARRGKAPADDPDDLPALTRLAGRLEPRMRRRFLEAARRAQDGVDLEALAGAVLRGDLTAIEAAAQVGALTDGVRRLIPVLQQGFLLGAQLGHDVLTQAGISMAFDLVNPHAVAFVQARGAELVTGVTDQAKLAVRHIVEQAFTEGIDPQKTARRIRDVVGLTERQAQAVTRFGVRLQTQGVAPDQVERRVERYAQAQLRRRADTIARTELQTASNRGQLKLWDEAARQGHLDRRRTFTQWLVTPDDLLDEECEALADVEVPLGELFPGGIDGPPLHLNCRCSTGLSFSESG